MRKEKKFIPKPGQIDFTEARYAPVVNCIVEHEGKFLIVKRSEEMRTYPGYWHVVAGHLDDEKGIVEKAKEELFEEAGIREENIESIKEEGVFEFYDEEYGKTWIIHPVRMRVSTDAVRIDWEASEYKWVTLAEWKRYELIPGFKKVFEALEAGR